MKVKSFLKRVAKYLLITGGLLLVLFGISVWIIFEKKNEWLLKQMQSYLNESQSGQLEIESLDLNLFRSLPDITIVLKGIKFYQHRDSLRAADERPILQAEEFFIALELIPLLREEVRISEVSLASAQIFLEKDKRGVTNWELTLAPPKKAGASGLKITAKKKSNPPVVQPKPIQPPDPKPQKSAVQVDLNHVALSDVRILWHNAGDRDTSAVTLSELEANLSNEADSRNITISSKQTLDRLIFKSKAYAPGDLTIESELTYQKKDQRLDLQDTKLNLTGFEVTLQGHYIHSKNQTLDLTFDASTNGMKFLTLVLKPAVLAKNKDLLKKGSLYLTGRIFGPLTDHQAPELDISFGARRLSWTLPKRDMAFENIGMDGRFRSGRSPDYSQASVEIRNLTGKLPGGNLNGNLFLKNFVTPYIRYNVRSNVKLDGYDEVFNLTSISNLSGEVAVQARFDGPLAVITGHRADSNRSSLIEFRNVSLVVNKTRKPLTGLTGKIDTREMKTTLNDLSFKYGENEVHLTAAIDNLLPYLFSRDAALTASGNFFSPRLFTRDLIPDTLANTKVREKVTNLKFDFETKTLVHDPIVRTKGLAFAVKNLSAQFDQLPNLVRVDTRGVWTKDEKATRLVVERFNAVLPNGTAEVTGSLTIENPKAWIVDAKVKVGQFPWTYIQELVAEMREDREPTAKNLPVSKMDLITGDAKVSAAIIPYPFDITTLALHSDQFAFLPAGSRPITGERIDLSLDQLLFMHPANAGNLTGLKFTKGIARIQKLVVPGLTLNNLSLNFNGMDDVLKTDFSCATHAAKEETGNLQLDISGKSPAYKLDYKVEKADLGKFMKSYAKRRFLDGAIDYQMSLSGMGSAWASIKKSLSGRIEISGSTIHLHGVDIDNVLKRYQKSQNFNLTDVGAVVIAGPIGLAVTKGSDFVSLATVKLDSSQHTTIQNLYTRWRLDSLKLTTEDVAFATSENRIAFNGQLDLANDSIPGITIAVVDKNGCSLMDQKLSGKFGALKTGKLNITKTVLGSVINFVNAIVGEDCKPVYTGRVASPHK